MTVSTLTHVHFSLFFFRAESKVATNLCSGRPHVLLKKIGMSHSL